MSETSKGMMNEMQPSLVSDDKGIFKHIIHLMILFFALQFVFIACNYVAECFPREPMAEHLEQSADNKLIKRIFKYKYHIYGSSATYDNNRFLKSMINKDEYGGDKLKASILDGIDYDDKHFEYYRYWHGWQLPAFICLSIGTIDVFAGFVGVVVVASTIWFVMELRKYLGWIAAIIFSAIAFFGTNLFGNFMGDLLLALSVFAVVAFCAAMLHIGGKGKHQRYRLDALCLASGSVFCFLDFFTVPSFVVALVAFSVLVACNVMNLGIKESLILFVRASILFVLGFALTWIVKWLSAAYYLGFEHVVNNITGETQFWTAENQKVSPLKGLPEFGDMFTSDPRLYSVLVSFLSVFTDYRVAEKIQINKIVIPLGILFCASVLLAVISLIRSRLVRDTKSAVSGKHLATQAHETESIKGVWKLLLPAFYVPAYAYIAFAHTIWHFGIFGYKPWSFFFADIAAVALLIAANCTGWRFLVAGRQRESCEE